MVKTIETYGIFGMLVLLFTCAYTNVLAVRNMDCPDKPNCVSSQVNDARHFIEPFTFSDSPVEAMKRLKKALLNEKRVTIVAEQENHLHAEVRSYLFQFVDDVEFSVLPEKMIIHIHSSARKGYYDFGVNRRRIERIRKRFQK